ncbi:PstS family phosphate ABC transporter substrate-binding protein [Desulfosporosinus hippei]|uniref:Phosphate transport system substrate-binding protein n=1 Tax=Desulfosporosinus hippei DSM 8344 TaxID=1121419 RepID=A0A1G7T4Y3_9FIRM|nr:substrate-binding domain-containing protein [Desulfosporosinus hippei]SDG30356.1 phosphate transport system substrate-binding protein [Desulfosporosinus hippei DSM 8344]
MQRIISLIVASLMLLTLCACSIDSTTEVQQPTLPSNTTQPAPTGNTDSTMTTRAAALGITAKNYPIIDGSTSTLSIVQAVYRAMYGEEGANTDGYPTKASKTVPSYRLLIEGKVDVIFVPYASADVLEEAENAGVELEFHKVAAEALIFITSAENPVESITLEQIREIYLNYGITNWSKLGGPDRKLIPICRNSDSGSQSQMDNLILNNQEMHPKIQHNYVELTMEGMLEQVAFYHKGGLSGSPTNSFALGYTLYTYLQQMNEVTGIGERLKILSFNGVPPTAENIAQGYYPLADGYYAVFRSDLSKDHIARAVITWLQGKDGAETIERLGLIPCAE